MLKTLKRWFGAKDNGPLSTTRREQVRHNVAQVPRPLPPYVRVLESGDAFRAARDKPIIDGWLKTLPPPARPVALAGIYPRIVMKIMRLWDDDEALKEYFDDLTVDRRGGRIGFPPKVADEILRLQTFILRRGPTRHS